MIICNRPISCSTRALHRQPARVARLAHTQRPVRTAYGRGRRGGFTLLELILSATMIAAIGAALYSSLSIAFKGRISAANQVQAMRECAIVMDLIQQDLQSILPPGGTLGGFFIGVPGGSAGAEADELEFRTIARDRTAADDDPFAEGPRRVVLALRTDRNPAALVREVEPNLLAPIELDPVEEVLSTRVQSLALRYFDGDAWYTEWDSQTDGGLPRAVEVTITFDIPSPVDDTRPYRMTQVIPLSCTAAPVEEDADE